MGDEMYYLPVARFPGFPGFPAFPGSQVPALSSFSFGPGNRLNRWPYGREPARWPALLGARFYIV